MKSAIDLLNSGFFSHGDQELFRPNSDRLPGDDPYLTCADFQSYRDCQEQVSQTYLDQEHWSRMSMLNVARIGEFSSDRAIHQYCEEIWRVNPCRVGGDSC